MKLQDLTPNDKNPRTITDKKLAQLKKALAKFGSLDGVIYNRKTKQLVGGHQRKSIFDPETTITYTKKYSKPTKSGTVAEGYFYIGTDKFPYREVFWDEMTEKAANIAANKGAGEWDMPQLGEWMKELSSFDVDFDLELTMFDSEELEQFGGITVKEHTRVSATGVDEDDVPEKAPARTKLGDLYQLGSHRLLCGDSTDSKQVARLMNGETADICFTSPPYNLGTNAKLRGHNASSTKTLYLDNDDDMTDENYLKFLLAWSELAIAHSRYLFCNIQMLAANKIALCDYMNTFKNRLVDIMIWDKEFGAPAMAPNVLNSAWEFIFILTREQNPKRSIKSGPEFRGTVPNIYRLNPRGKKDELAKDHGAVFPVALAEHFVEHFTKNSVLDLFGGSGTTMIAAEKTHRTSFLMELDPHYCDVIVERWERYTGQKAKMLPRIVTQTKKAVKQLKEQVRV